MAALLTMILGIGVALYCFHDAGAISDEAFLAVMVFVVAASSGILIGMDIEKDAQRGAQQHIKEVPPPFDVYTIWPPECGWLSDKPSGKRDIDPPKRRSTKRDKS